MVGPGVRPEDGVTRYAKDKTQGPVCAMACPAGTIYRNYFANGTGGRQLNGACDIAALCNNKQKNYWEMRNGYMMSTRPESMQEVSVLLEDTSFHEEVIARLRVGVHWSTETEVRTTSASSKSVTHRVCQVFSSAAPVSYDIGRRSDWQALATAILEGTFEATLAAAAVIAHREARRVTVFLTQVGGGAFGNATTWIERALRRALTLYRDCPLDVKLVHYGTKPANKLNKFIVLEKEFKKQQRLQADVTKDTTTGNYSTGGEKGNEKKT